MVEQLLDLAQRQHDPAQLLDAHRAPGTTLVNVGAFALARTHHDGIDAIDEHGCVDVPEGPGPGVEYAWDFILAHRTAGTVYK